MLEIYVIFKNVNLCMLVLYVLVLKNKLSLVLRTPMLCLLV